MSSLPDFVLADELLAVRDADYAVAGEQPWSSSADCDAVGAALTRLVDALAAAPAAVEEAHTFAQLLSLVKHYALLGGVQRITLLDALASAYTAALEGAAAALPEGTDAYRAWAPVLERLAFALQWLIHVAERAAGTREERAAAPVPKGRRGRGAKAGMPATRPAAAASAASADLSGYDWEGVLPGLLMLLARSLKLSTALLFPAAATRDAFVACALRPALLLQETEAHLRVPAIKAGIFRVVCAAVKGHAQAFAVQASIAQALAYYEHLAEPMAELLALLRAEYDYERLADDVLRDVGAREFGGIDTRSPRAFARFLVRFTELCPRTVLRSISLLMKHLDSESYPMRNALLEILGHLIKELTSTDDALPGAAAAEVEGLAALDSTHAMGGNAGSADAQRGSAEARKKQVKHFWELLFERFLDVNSYVRVKCVQVCTRLCDLQAKFPSQRTMLADFGVQALRDKSSSVRKAAIALLTRLILTHPYGVLHGGDLDEPEWTARLAVVDAELKTYEGLLDLPNEGPDEENEEESEDDDVEDSLVMATPRKRAERRTNKRRSSAGLDLIQGSSLSSEDAEKVMRLRLTRRYYADALHFIAQLSGAMDELVQLLVSKSKAEVLESMEFFRVAHEYRLPGATVGVRKMVHLIWTKDNALVMEDGAQLKGIRSRLLEVYRALYFEPLPDLSPRDNVARIARNMVERTFGATLAELTSLEELLRTMCAEDMVHPDVVNKLWAVYGAPRAMPRAQRRGAIIVLSMLAVARREIVADHIEALLGVGLGPLGARDIVLAKYTCVALARVGGSIKKVKGALSDEQVRFPMTHPMFAKLRAAVMWQNGTAANGEWFSLAENAIQTIYQLGEQPDALCAEIVKSMTARVFGPRGPTLVNEEQEGSVRGLSPLREDAEDEESTSDGARTPAQRPGSPGGTPAASAASEAGACSSKAPAFGLAQLLFVVGHVALKQIVYLELVEREYKRRKADADKAKLSEKSSNAQASSEADEQSGTAKKGRKGKKGAAAAAAAAAAVEADAAAKENDIEQVAGNAEDEIGDVVGDVREKELLFGPRSLLALFGSVVAQICSSPKSFANDYLRKASVLSMCKFMCVSSEYCEAHLPLLLSILTHSGDAVVRSNIVIALGDIAVSFGSLVDENSERLYAGLADRDLGVKKHTLMVLTHLILNGMIKVKGQLGEMAKCIEDDEERVSDLAKLFFSELATKENAVYNNLPDIISHLSIGKHAVDEETFASTMRYIFQFIDKERQAENVVEKLCQRFRLTAEPRQWRDIAFCLSLLPYKSDRSMKRLIEGLPFYQDKLHDAGVFEAFSQIVQKARMRGPGGGAAAAAAAAGMEGDLVEFEQILEQYRSKGEEESALAKMASKKRARGKRGEATFKAVKAAPAAPQRRARRRVVATSDTDEGSE